MSSICREPSIWVSISDGIKAQQKTKGGYGQVGRRRMYCFYEACCNQVLGGGWLSYVCPATSKPRFLLHSKTTRAPATSFTVAMLRNLMCSILYLIVLVEPSLPKQGPTINNKAIVILYSRRYSRERLLRSRGRSYTKLYKASYRCLSIIVLAILVD